MPTNVMNGAESLVRSLLGAGIDTCFANPGTSEMHFVAALDQIAGMRCVLGLHETVCTGAADGYWRMAGKPASTLLHCGPGLTNGMANLHNARRARSGIVNIVGDQATYHRPFDAPLTADTDSLARTVSAWVRTSMNAADVGRDAMAAVQAARTSPGQIATLILPSDSSWDAGGEVAQPLAPLPPPPLDPGAVQQVARVLRSGEPTLILLNDAAARAKGQALAWRIAAATGAQLMNDYVNGSVARGQGTVPVERVPYPVDVALAALGRFRHIVLVNAKPPVAFFGYPGKPSRLYPADAQLHVLSRIDQDAEAALQALIDELGAPVVPGPVSGPRPEAVRGAPTADGFAQTVGAILPEGAVVVDESLTYGRSLYRFTHAAAPHDWLHAIGGAIGGGLPLATGAAIGSGGQRRVVNLQADGSALYSLQALWTQAREKLPCTTVLLNNRSYNILIGELKAVGATAGPTAMGMFELGRPALDWVSLAQGFGVEAARATTLEQCADLMQQSFRQSGPFFIDLMI